VSKIHLHTEQFDGQSHSWCGRGTVAVTPVRFEATPTKARCKLCEREWFPAGQPEWHVQQAKQRLEESITAYYRDRNRGGWAQPRSAP